MPRSHISGSAKRPLDRLTLTVLAALLAACEPRVEEPVPPPRPDTATAPVSAAPHASAAPRASTSTAPEPAASGSARRAPACMLPTPDVPTRKVTLETPFDPKCPPDDLKTPPVLAKGKVVFLDAKNETVQVEIAEKDEHRMRGLMFRKSMADDHGMIFVFEGSEEHAFWMKNTCIPLDMLFIDADGVIVGIQENVPTLSTDTFSVRCPSKYVLELNAGWTRKHGVKAGQRIEFSRT